MKGPKKTIVKKLKFQNHIKHLWKKSKHNSLHFQKAYFAHLLLIRLERFLTDLDAQGGGLQNCLKFKKQQTM
jgi:hypothetical protein